MQAIVQGNLVIVAAYALIAVATYLIAHMVFKEQEAREAAENLDELRNRKASSTLVKITRPVFSQYVAPMIRGKAFWDSRRKSYRRKIITAGLKDELTPDEFIAFKATLIVFFPIVGGLLKAGDFLDLSNLVIIGSGVAGWFYPDFWVKKRIEARHQEMRKSLPFIVDLLALSTEAGLDFVGAMQKVVEKAKSSPLVDEFEQVLKEIKVGSSRSEALREMSLRVNMPEINSFIAILISADQMGASIGKVLRQQSDMVRTERFVRAEKEGAKAAPKLIMITVLIVMPAVLIMIGAPFLLGMMYGN